MARDLVKERYEQKMAEQRRNAPRRVSPPPVPQTRIPVPGERPSLEERFATYHAENPNVYRRLVGLAMAARRRGAKRLGMKQLFEVLRWETMIETSDPDGFKLNNDFTAPYARLIMETVPELDGVFEIRHSRVDEPETS